MIRVFWAEEEVWNRCWRLGRAPVCVLRVKQGVRWAAAGYVLCIASVPARSASSAVGVEATRGARPVGRSAPREIRLQRECRLLVARPTPCNTGYEWPGVGAAGRWWKWEKGSDCTASVKERNTCSVKSAVCQYSCYCCRWRWLPFIVIFLLHRVPIAGGWTGPHFDIIVVC